MTYDRAALAAQLRIDEGVRDRPYRDSRGIWTAGVGHNLEAHGIDPASLPAPIPDATIDAWLGEDIGEAEAALDANLSPWRALSDGRQRALLNLCFNLGWAKLATFATFLGYILAENFDAAAEDLLGTLYAREVGARAERVAALLRQG